SVETYSTFGFDFLGRDELVAAATELYGKGYRHLKMVVGHRGLQHRDRGRPLSKVIEEDARRVRAVHDAIPEDATLYIDANCSLDLFHAERLARSIADCRIGFFEEPITQNDAVA